MLSVIKTAIVTIIISFISGVLLDYYRNYAPRIVCSIRQNRSIRKNDKKIKVYSITIKNISKKTIHDLNVNITAQCDNFKLHGTKITNGLRFDVSNEEEMYNITIPFLCNNDEFSTKVLLENAEAIENRPHINLKSPENFKQIDYYKNKKNDNKQRIVNNINEILEKVFYNNRRIILSCISVLIVVFIGILAGEHYSNSIKNEDKQYNKTNSENYLQNNNESNGTSIDSNYNSEDSLKNDSAYNEKEFEDSSDNYVYPSDNTIDYSTDTSQDEQTATSVYKENETTVDGTSTSEDTTSKSTTETNGETTNSDSKEEGNTENTTTDEEVTEDQGEDSGDSGTEYTTDPIETTTATGENFNNSKE